MTPVLCSSSFIKQYFQSFAEDPIMNELEQTVSENHGSEETNGHNDDFDKIKSLLKEEKYESIIEACNEILETSEDEESKDKALLLRGTFYILSKRQNLAHTDLDSIIEKEGCSVKIRANALIKRASLYIQQCKDPINDPLMAMKDFKRSEEIDPNNCDVYHHRGQVNLLTEQLDEAAADFKKAVDINDTFPVAYVQKLYTDYRLAVQKNNQVCTYM
jgi:import receptor subunit TOM70